VNEGEMRAEIGSVCTLVGENWQGLGVRCVVNRLTGIYIYSSWNVNPPFLFGQHAGPF
jgi:hypothetical protein